MMTTYRTKTARQDILDTYEPETLKEIAKYGCITGIASHHIYYTQTTEFYDQHEEEILNHLNLINHTTDSVLSTFGNDAEDIKQLKNSLVWTFVESVAEEYLLEMEEEE